MPATLIVAHSNPTFREILSNILQRQNSLQVVAKAATAAELLQAANTYKPEIIITDVALSGLEGFTLKMLAVCCRQAKIIISWQYKDEAAMGAALSAGYAGYISHDATPGEYSPAIKEIMKGNVFHCYRTQKLISQLHLHGAADAALQKILTEKYVRLAYCMQLGFSSKETAIAVGLSKETVDTYRKFFNKVLGSQSSAAIEHFMRAYERY